MGLDIDWCSLINIVSCYRRMELRRVQWRESLLRDCSQRSHTSLSYTQLTFDSSSLVYIDADARMDTFNDAEGNKRTSLSLIARE